MVCIENKNIQYGPRSDDTREAHSITVLSNSRTTSHMWLFK